MNVHEFAQSAVDNRRDQRNAEFCSSYRLLCGRMARRDEARLRALADRIIDLRSREAANFALRTAECAAQSFNVGPAARCHEVQS